MATGRYRDVCPKSARAATLIYIHIPKCAGSTMMGVLRANYSNEFYRVPIGKWNEFKKASSEFKQGIGCLAGHFPYGLHRSLPQAHIYATMLREPVARVFSLYKYIQGFRRHPWFTIARQRSFVGFVTKSGMVDAQNGMTRWLSGRRHVGAKKSSVPATEEDLALAKLHLWKMPAVGFVETFDESLAEFAHMLGWQETGYKMRQVGKNKRRATDEERQAVQNVNRFDVRLYEWARSNL